MYPRIRNFREDKDLTQTEIAKLLGMSQTGYSKYETTLAQFYGVSTDYLLGLTDVQEPYPRAKK